MKPPAGWFFLLLSLASSIRAQEPPSRPEPGSPAAEIYEIDQLLKVGLWNERLHAVYRLQNLGVEALPSLESAARDADWQVRLTAVHFMGRLGKIAIKSLAAVLKGEPCRHVRLTAVNWLGSMGPEAESVLKEALSDESHMLRLTDRYWLRKMDPKGAEAEPEKFSEAAEAGAASHEDLKACFSSYQPARAPWVRTPQRALKAGPVKPEKEPARPIIKEELPAPPRTGAEESLPKRGDRLRELDALLAPRQTESFPAGPPGLSREEAVPAGGEILPDAGKPKPPHDPLPELLKFLEDPEPRRRARAADEIGKLGAGAVSAVAALRAALKDSSHRVRASAALALGNIGAPSDPAVPELERALKDPSEDVQWSAAVALGRMKTRAARKAFRRHLREQAAAWEPEKE